MSFLKKPFAFDLLAALGVAVLAAVFYFSLVKPVSFSGQIGREAVPVYAEVELAAGPELLWLKDKVPPGTENRLVHGQLDWQLLEMQPWESGGKTALRIRVKMRLMQTEGGRLWYQKSVVRIGDTLILTNPQYVLRGWIYDFKLLNESGTL